jgi:hypothetical protein
MFLLSHHQPASLLECSLERIRVDRCPWIWNSPMPFRSSRELGCESSGLFFTLLRKCTWYWHMISYITSATGMSSILYERALQTLWSILICLEEKLLCIGIWCCRKPDQPLTLLEINHGSWHEEPMAACSCTNTCDIKMGSTRVSLFNGPVGIACTCLSGCKVGSYQMPWHTYLYIFLTTPKMGLI